MFFVRMKAFKMWRLFLNFPRKSLVNISFAVAYKGFTQLLISSALYKQLWRYLSQFKTFNLKIRVQYVNDNTKDIVTKAVFRCYL